MIFDQEEFDVRFEWGERGVTTMAQISDIVVIVDVLSFSTSVNIAVSQGALVFPYRWKDHQAVEYAASMGGELAGNGRSLTPYSLSPQSLMDIPKGTRLVLPSPNGSTLTLAAKPTPVLAGCFRNAKTTAIAARQYGQKIAVIAAGERWQSDSSLRPCFEDLLGAGAIISYLGGRLSPEASSAAAAFRELQPQIHTLLRECSSGKELIQKGFIDDVDLAAQLNVSDCAAIFLGEAFTRFSSKPSLPEKQ